MELLPLFSSVADMTGPAGPLVDTNAAGRLASGVDPVPPTASVAPRLVGVVGVAGIIVGKEKPKG